MCSLRLAVLQFRPMIKHNTRIYLATQLFHSLIFAIPVWIAYYQGFLTPVEITIIMVVQYVLQMLMELPSGALADLLGRRTSLVLAFAIGAVSYFIYFWATDFWSFLFLSVLLGVSDSFRSGSEEALVYDTYRQEGSEDFDKILSKGNLVYQAGLVIGTLTGGFLYGLHMLVPFILCGISLAIGFVLTLFYKEPSIDSERFTFRNYGRQIAQGTKEAFKDKLTAYTSLFYIAVGGITWTNQMFFGSYFILGLKFGDTERGLIQGGVRLLNALAIAYVLSKVKFSDKARVIFFPIVMILGFLPGAFVQGWAGVPVFELAMLAGTSRWIFLTPLTNKAFSSKVRATAISVLSLLVGFVYIAIVGASGPIIEHGGIGVMYSVLGVITILTAVPLGGLLVREMGKNSAHV
jgi:MFS family permease